ncbi:MAG: radical SAM protein [Candidatus Eremiobacteraeota bacterium]|nr:radical SAM protein [Candidatus Eremiobacteraeota bacterium]
MPKKEAGVELIKYFAEGIKYMTSGVETKETELKNDENVNEGQSASRGISNCRIALISLYDLENNAVRLMAALLRKHGFYVAEIYFKDWKNNFFSPPTYSELKNLIKLLKEKKINIASISLRASAYLNVAVQITQMIRKETGLPVIWGGTHVILCPDESIQTADITCVGEGEFALLELCERLGKGEPLESITDINNLWFRKGDKIIKNPLSNLVEDLDIFPFRDYTSVDKYQIFEDKIQQGDPMINDPIFQIITSRGCPYHCAYCYNSTLRKIYNGLGKYYRTRSVDNVIEELKLAKKTFLNLKRIKFDDEVFNFKEDWVAEFREKYKKEIDLPFECFTEPKLVTKERFKLMKEAGLQIVFMGIQNSFRITEELYDRNVPEEKIKEAAAILYDLKLDARYQVILDDPLSITEDKERLFKLLMSFKRPFELYLFSLTIFPNTEVARKLLEQGIITEDQIEGKDTKTFRQLRVDLAYPREPEDQYWAALLVLLTKNFIPKSLLWKFYNNRNLRKNPGTLVFLAQMSNFIKMAFVAAGMLFRGELTWTAFRRWMNMKSMITQ